MRGIAGLKFAAYVSVLAGAILLPVSAAWAKNITIDGSSADWSVITDTFAAMPHNTAVQVDGEWIWKDMSGDIISRSGFSSEATESADLTEFRITASSGAIYFLARFSSLSASLTGYMYPQLQIALSVPGEVGQKAFLLGSSADTSKPDKVRVSDDANWTVLLQSFQTENSQLAISTGNSVWIISADDSLTYRRDSAYTSMARVLSTGPANMMELSVSTAALPLLLGQRLTSNTLRFSVAVSFASMPFGVFVSSQYVKRYGNGDETDLVDTISLSSSTVSSIIDFGGLQFLDSYFDVSFDLSGNVAADRTRPALTGGLRTDRKKNNGEVFLSSNLGPAFTWTYSDLEGDIQRGGHIQVGTDSDWTDADGIFGGPAEKWDYRFSLSTATTAEESPLFSPVRYAGLPLDKSTTYYIRLRVVNVKGITSEWTYGRFITAASSLSIDGSVNSLIVDWNNPFTPGSGPETGQTKLRYCLSRDADIVLAIYDISGQRIRTLDEGNKIGDAGIVKTVEWDGRTDEGDTVSSGLYFAHLRITARDGNTTGVTKKVFVIR